MQYGIYEFKNLLAKFALISQKKKPSSFTTNSLACNAH